MMSITFWIDRSVLQTMDRSVILIGRTNRPIDRSVDGSIDSSFEGTNERWIDRSIDRSIHQSIDPSFFGRSFDLLRATIVASLAPSNSDGSSDVTGAYPKESRAVVATVRGGRPP